MKKLFWIILSLFLTANLLAEDIVIEDWKKGIDGWKAMLSKGDAPVNSLKYDAKRKCAEVKIPAELILIEKANVPIKGVVKLKLTITPLDIDFYWLEVGIIFQSSVAKWKVLGLKQVKKEQKQQIFEFEIDGDWHSDSDWNKLMIRLNSHKEVNVRVEDIIAVKE